MALNKQVVNINFAGGMDTKTDPFQVSLEKFISLKNIIFTVGDRLTKRNGYENLASLPQAATYATTFNDDLTAIGNSVQVYSSGSNYWINKGNIYPLELSTLSVIRSNTNQNYCDLAVSSNGLGCLVYTDQNPASLSSPQYKYVIFDSITGQNIVSPTLITPTTGTLIGTPKVFLLGNRFIVVFGTTITAVNHLQYLTISTVVPTNVTAAVDITANYTPTTTGSFDGVVANNKLYLVWNGNDMGGAIRMVSLTVTLVLSSIKVVSGFVGTIVSVCADNTGNTPIIYASFYDSVAMDGFTMSVDQNLNTIFSPQQIITAQDIANLASCAQNGICTVYSEVANAYSYDSGIDTNYINAITVTSAGVVGVAFVLVRSVGIASKAFIIDGKQYLLSSYSSLYQPTYFLIDGSLSFAARPLIVAKLAYSNGGGYLSTGIPNVVVNGTKIQFPYLFKDLITAVNKNTNVSSGTQVNGIYSQTGINVATINLGTEGLATAEIGENLSISGGFLWGYDGYSNVENNFFLWPDNVEVTTATGSGGLIAQEYFYQATYEWSDNQGNVFRSSPSIPINITTTTASSTNTIHIPTLRLTYKINNPVKISLYRWSQAQQVYYQITSITTPTLNSTTIDSVSITDALADSAILGNNILYTTGGVLENINGPASNIFTLFDNRFWLVDAEDQNLLWYSKQVIEATPVEMSDLLTLFVAPTTASQGPTGPITALSVMDDKLILFKKNAIYYINGIGPDNTGANSQYSQPIFVTSTVGCTNPNSIVFTPNGLMFQSDKGIWILKRDLSTSYIGDGVEEFNSSLVQSAVSVPETNQVRFTLNTGETLMYDYYYNKWGTFVGAAAISSTIYQSLHTIINSFGEVLQESPGLYLDGSNPVLVSFTTAWINLAGLQGYERIYYMYLLGQFISPHFLSVQIAYDYNSAPTQQSIINPQNYTGLFGSDQLFGQTTPYGGPGSLEQWKIHTQKQLTQAFQVTVNEIYNSQFSTIAGGGLNLSGMAMVVGMKKGYKPINQVSTVG